MVYSIIILSFVVQNLFNNAFLVKTYRYKSFVCLFTVDLLYILSKCNNIQNFYGLRYTSISEVSLYLNNIYLLKPFWKIFKKKFSKKLGTITSNITKLNYYLFYENINSKFQYIPSQVSYLKKKHPSIIYLIPNTLIPFNLENQVYSTLIFYFISLLTTFYLPLKLNFKFYYSFIWRNPSLLNYSFINQFYLRLKNY